jgi:hypothetical protein
VFRHQRCVGGGRELRMKGHAIFSPWRSPARG